MESKKEFNQEEAEKIGEQLGIKWDKFDIDQFIRGMNIELEHGSRDAETNVTDNDPVKTGKIALAHLKEFPDYYDRLKKLEKEADDFWRKEQ